MWRRFLRNATLAAGRPGRRGRGRPGRQHDLPGLDRPVRATAAGERLAGAGGGAPHGAAHRCGARKRALQGPSQGRDAAPGRGGRDTQAPATHAPLPSARRHRRRSRRTTMAQSTAAASAAVARRTPAMADPMTRAATRLRRAGRRLRRRTSPTTPAAPKTSPTTTRTQPARHRRAGRRVRSGSDQRLHFCEIGTVLVSPFAK